MCAAVCAAVPADQARSNVSTCPSPSNHLSAPGCPCTMPNTLDTASPNSSKQQQQSNICPAGHRCSPSAAAAVVAAGWAKQLQNGTWGVPGGIGAAAGELELAAASTGICVPCQLGGCMEQPLPGLKQEDASYAYYAFWNSGVFQSTQHPFASCWACSKVYRSAVTACTSE